MKAIPWLREHRRSAVLAVVVTAVSVVTLAGQPAFADANLVANPGLEVLDGNGFPVCWEPSGWRPPEG